MSIEDREPKKTNKLNFSRIITKHTIWENQCNTMYGPMEIDLTACIYCG